MEARVAALEAKIGQGDLDQRLIEAEQKRVDMLKDLHASKIELLAEEHEADKQPDEPAQPEEPPKDDRASYGLGRFDPSSGSQAQKSPKHPMGDAFVPVPMRTHAEHAQFLREAAGNPASRDGEQARMREMIAAAEADTRCCPSSISSAARAAGTRGAPFYRARQSRSAHPVKSRVSRKF
jgi:hypothetical protein